MSQSAELIIINANIHTLDDHQPRAEAIAIREGRVFAVGCTDEIERLADANTRRIDAGGRLVLPGLQATQ
jgi:predicted amidohydrolase YtcJ